jgi:FkbM family methyltransferase
MTVSERELQAYNEWTDNGLERLRYEYDLNNTSVCFDLGTFHGDWAMDISNKYNRPTIYSFEILPAIYEVARQNTLSYPNIHLFNYGIGKSSYHTTINVGETDGASTSLFIDGDTKVEVDIKSIKEVFHELQITSIDVMKLNVEGAEYDILECLIEDNLHLLVKNFQIQFHKMIPNYLDRYAAIREALAKSHKTTYDYYFVWENWKIK